jgi:3-oxosteroid 1-dehydrogenase
MIGFQRFDAAYDVIIVRSGMGAAATASNLGLKILVVEKTNYIGGAGAHTLGGIRVPNNHLQSIALEMRPMPKMRYAPPPTHPPPSSREKVGRYLKNLIGDDFDHDNFHAYLTRAPQVLKWMQENTEVNFHPALTRRRAAAVTSHNRGGRGIPVVERPSVQGRVGFPR